MKVILVVARVLVGDFKRINVMYMVLRIISDDVLNGQI